MTPKGKRLLIICAGSLLAVFIVLYLYAGHLAGAKGVQTHAGMNRPAIQTAQSLHTDVQARKDSTKTTPAQRLASTLLGKARDLYESNRLSDAVILLEMSLFLDSENTCTRAWLREVEQQLSGLVQEYISLGNADYLNKRYDRAIYNWERVLFLLKDKTSSVYAQTLQKIGYAKEKMKP